MNTIGKIILSTATGKYLIEKLMTEYAEKLETEGREFVLKDFLNDYNNAGSIPVELIRYEMVGD